MNLYSTLSGQTEKFTPKNDTISIYVCGITPYDTTHLGHAFTYISFDVLIRYLKYKGYKINYTQNVTDINDRDNDILKRANEQKVPWGKLSDYWTKRFLTDMKNLNWIMPNNYLYASKNISSMTSLIQKLIKKGIAYKVNGSVYLEIAKDKEYGKLSKLSKTKMLKIAKDYEEDVENPNKKNPLDITLWRAGSLNQPKHIPFFESPFGKGRPGWHIECSAMAISSLDEQVDIHGGGKDLIYPHHEAEIAQSENATGKIPFAKLWIHTGIIYYKKQKMSKSLGNLVLISDLLKKYSANSIRFLLLSHKYRNDWEFKISDINKAGKQYLKIEKALNKKLNGGENYNYMKRFEKVMENDLSTDKALELIANITDEINNRKNISKQSQLDLKKMLDVLGFQNSL